MNADIHITIRKDDDNEILEVWYDAKAVPQIGASIVLDRPMRTTELWNVTRVEWKDGNTVTLYVRL